MLDTAARDASASRVQPAPNGQSLAEAGAEIGVHRVAPGAEAGPDADRTGVNRHRSAAPGRAP